MTNNSNHNDMRIKVTLELEPETICMLKRYARWDGNGEGKLSDTPISKEVFTLLIEKLIRYGIRCHMNYSVDVIQCIKATKLAMDTLDALRKKYPEEQIAAILEPIYPKLEFENMSDFFEKDDKIKQIE